MYAEEGKIVPVYTKNNPMLNGVAANLIPHMALEWRLGKRHGTPYRRKLKTDRSGKPLLLPYMPSGLKLKGS